jgi:hypothetical protein
MGYSVILDHHAGKSGDQRGTSGREDNLDITIKLTHPAGYKPEDGCDFDVEFTKARGVFGDGAASFNFKIIEDTEGGLTWVTDAVGSGTRDVIVAMLGSGIPQKDIPNLLNCGRAWVSRVKTGAIKDGLLKKKGEFTQLGRLRFGSVDIEEFT